MKQFFVKGGKLSYNLHFDSKTCFVFGALRWIYGRSKPFYGHSLHSCTINKNNALNMYYNYNQTRWICNIFIILVCIHILELIFTQFIAGMWKLYFRIGILIMFTQSLFYIIIFKIKSRLRIGSSMRLAKKIDNDHSLIVCCGSESLFSFQLNCCTASISFAIGTRTII